MGKTGANGFPCCSKDSVDIVDTQVDLNQPAEEQLQPEEEEKELENDLLELDPVPNKEPDPLPNQDLDQDVEVIQEDNDVPPLESYPASTLEPESVKPYNENPEKQKSNTASLQTSTQGLSRRYSSLNSVSGFPDKDRVSNHRSIFVQTSKHLFWADKLTQASEQSLKMEASKQRGDKSTDTTTSDLNKESPSVHASSSNLAPVISLKNLINFASSLAIASSSNKDLPNLEDLIKGPPPKAVKEPEQEKLPSETALEAGEPQKPSEEEDKKTLHPYYDFNKPEHQRTAFEGKVKFIRTPARSSSVKGDADSEPETKKETPLLLKIHFKLLPTSPPREMTKQNQ